MQGAGLSAATERVEKDNQIEHHEVDWKDMKSDFPDFAGRIEAFAREEWDGLAELWGRFLSFYMWSYLPDLNYEPGEEWVERARGSGESI